MCVCVLLCIKMTWPIYVSVGMARVIVCTDGIPEGVCVVCVCVCVCVCRVCVHVCVCVRACAFAHMTR